LGEARQLAAAVAQQQWQGRKWQCNSATAVVAVAATWLRRGGRGAWWRCGSLAAAVVAVEALWRRLGAVGAAAAAAWRQRCGSSSSAAVVAAAAARQ
jgi:hypothetical protein